MLHRSTHSFTSAAGARHTTARHRNATCRVVCRATATSAPSTGQQQTPLTAEQVAKRQKQLQELVQESIKITMETGPRGFVRSLQAANAVATLVQEQVLQGQLDPPQTVLRKLFEKLGATYVKLGQVRGWWEKSSSLAHASLAEPADRRYGAWHCKTDRPNSSCRASGMA